MRPFNPVLSSIMICFMAIYIASCGINDSDSDITPAVSKIDFPMAVGMLWTYEVYDSLTGTTDTVQVSVVGTAIDDGDRHKWLWKYNQNDSIMSKYYKVSGDTLIMTHDTLNDFPDEYIIFPLDPDNMWTGPSDMSDTSRVTEVGLISVPAGSFDGSRIDRSWRTDFEGGGNYSSTWIAPDAGIVSRYLLSRYSDGATITITRNEEWKLMSYDLSTFEIDRFPMSTGTEWVYETHENYTDTYDTLHIIIGESTMMLDSIEAIIWEFTYSDSFDTHYAVISDNRLYIYSDTLKIFDPPQIGPIDVFYEFPFAVGRYWGMEFFVPVPDIIEKGSVTVPAGTFENGFRHYYPTYSFNYFRDVDSWLVPDVGVVSRIVTEYDFGPGLITTWKLLEYKLIQ